MTLAENRRLAALIKGVRATMLISDLDTKVQRAIVNKATAVRLFAEAGFRAEALSVLDEIEQAYNEDPRRKMIAFLVEDVRKIWRFNGDAA
jgi:hypothetical protein